jgi:hypothetical protein
MSMPVRRLYAYCDLLVERMKSLKAQVEATDSKRETAQIERQIEVLSKRYDIARGILWQEIKHEFQEQAKESTGFGIRKGWKVCVAEIVPPEVQIVKLG